MNIIETYYFVPLTWHSTKLVIYCTEMEIIMKKSAVIFMLLLLCIGYTFSEKQSLKATNHYESTISTTTAENLKHNLLTQQIYSDFDNFTPILNSYYSYNKTDAYRILNSNFLKRILSHWVDTSIVNPVWNYDSFTKYKGKNLYYCTFTDESGNYYYMVLKYSPEDGGGIGQVRYSKTSYEYDLNSIIDKTKNKLSKTKLDLSSTTALRAQRKGSEVIIFKDTKGNKYVCNLDSLKIRKRKI